MIRISTSRIIASCFALLPLLTLLSSTCNVHASPLDPNIVPAQKRNSLKIGQLTITEDDEFFGIRQVPEIVADEYNKKGTLTQVRANGLNLGKGAYLTPQMSDRPLSAVKGKPTMWQCIVFVNKTAIRDKNTLKIFLDAIMINPPPGYGLGPKPDLTNVKVGQTIIFAYYNRQMGMQVVIPPPFLEPTSLPPEYHDEPNPAPGKNSLGLKVHCIPPDGLSKLNEAEAKVWKQVAKWEDMGIPQWPKGTKAWFSRNGLGTSTKNM